jgi:hypothetical protein
MDCEKLHAFADGELPSADIPGFQRHLVGCPSCRHELRDVLILEALYARRSPVAVAVTSWAPTPQPRPPSLHRTARPRHRTPWAWRGAVAAAAAVVIVSAVRRRSTEVTDELLSGPRPFAARVAWPAADRYRPLQTLRTTTGPADARPMPVQALARLQARGDGEALAAAYLLAGVPAQAELTLMAAPRTPAADNDRAVLAMQQLRWDQARTLLERVLADNPEHAQARWNLALVLEQLGELSDAARAFELVAARREPGWSGEAAQRAAALSAAP